MKRIINYDMIVDGGGGQKPSEKPISKFQRDFFIPQGCAIGQCSCAVGSYSSAVGCSYEVGYCSVPNCIYGTKVDGNYGQGSYGNQGQDGNVYTGITQSHSEGDYPDVYDKDDLVYYRHLYRTELGILGLQGIGINKFRLFASVNRDDRELCKKIVNKFNNKMATKFEKRLHAALLRKKEIDEQKEALLKKLNLKKVTAKSKYEQQLQNLRSKNTPSGFESFIKELKDERFKGYNQEQYIDQIREDNIAPPKPVVPEKTDDDRVNYYNQIVLSEANNYGTFYEAGEDKDSLKYFDFTFRPAIEEDSTDLDIFVELGGKATEFEEKSTNEMVRGLKDDNTVPNTIGNFLGKFTKKKTFVKKIRVSYDKILEKAKEKYG